MNNILSFIIEYKILVSAVISGIIYNFYKDPKVILITFSTTMVILHYLEKKYIYENFKIFSSVTDRNFFCKAIDKVSSKCQGHISKKDCSKGKKCNECEKFNYHLNKTRKILNSILSKKYKK
jgi:hypothetical protein